ncbi:MAG: hypothetical protein NVS3B5_01670 [Sphingomicrobium sp.]
MEGWIDDVQDGIVWGRVMVDGEELEFWTPLLCVMESQRVDLQPGSYVTIVNDTLAVNSAMWTTHDMETADAEAKRLYEALGWGSRAAGQKRGIMHLTYLNSDGHKATASTVNTGEAGAPDKIEITPEMLDRGVQAFLWNRSMEYETEDEVVGLILKAVLGDQVKLP